MQELREDTFSGNKNDDGHDNGAKYCVGPLGYYTRIDNRSAFGEKRLSLEDRTNKHLEESIQRRAEMEE
uniref:Uncharacterized protein n=1 Tax=Tanacetum cinerariifolium TaxID=118510 RepID=A0A6L2M7X1_TANCI|nr:hypothetical protein [Tanacetum cinerariifolium]